jgi:hypothetical protein
MRGIDKGLPQDRLAKVMALPCLGSQTIKTESLA